MLIAPDAVLTAAHCLDARRNSAATIVPDVYIGGPSRDIPIEARNNSTETGNASQILVQTRKTVLSIPHPDWNGILEDGNNLAILKLEEETCVEPIFQLGADDAQNQRDLPFMGYGRTGNRGDHSHHLLVALFNTFNASYCNERYEVDPPLTHRELCARGQNTVGMCVGDEGGPMILIPTFYVHRDVLIGLASFTTASCGNTEGVSVFMNVMHYRDWINETRKAASLSTRLSQFASL